ncbi:hypothetical protein K7X08_032062 [Anisodus acutangulus]|uniref:Pentatricopeptide repeat-containing protein n=1 Tax=Anisodus acutangulus TaxID=402998 RepID=A0A9Q1MMA0_9SOLA|nr:hypothetical protein K7X08_032062 [Anisodus acutangulus]
MLLSGGFFVADLFPSWKLLHNISGEKSRMVKAHKKIDALMENIINEHNKNKAIGNNLGNGRFGDEDLVDVLLRIKDNAELQFPITNDHLKAVLFEYTSFLMIWRTECTLSLLARHYRTLIRTYARYLAVDVGTKLHASIITTGLQTFPNTYLRNAVLQMYAACGCVLSARKVFDEIPLSYKDTVDWTTLMGCYARGGLPVYALNMFVEMRKNDVLIDEFTMVTVFVASAKLGCEQFGVQGHGCMVKMGFGSSIKACNAAMDMYVKCGLIDKTRRIFNEMEEKSLVSWTVLLGGVVKWDGFENARLLFDEMPDRNKVASTIMTAAYIEKGLTKEAFGLLREMVFEIGFELNFVALSSWLSACAQSGNVIVVLNERERSMTFVEEPKVLTGLFTLKTVLLGDPRTQQQMLLWISILKTTAVEEAGRGTHGRR